MSATTPVLGVEVSDGVAMLRIQDAPRRNALSSALLEEVDAVRSRDDVAAFVLTGSGGYFSAGADVDELLSGSWTGAEPSGPPLLFRAITEDPRPWIAAVNGPAFGGGAELCLSCDFVLMSDEAYLTLPETSLGVVPNTAVGLIPGGGGLPHPAAMELLLGLRRLGAEDAVRVGLANAVCPEDQLEDSAAALARRILATVAPRAFALIKRSLRSKPADTWEAISAVLAEADPEEIRLGIEAMQHRTRHDFSSRWTDQSKGVTS